MPMIKTLNSKTLTRYKSFEAQIRGLQSNSPLIWSNNRQIRNKRKEDTFFEMNKLIGENAD